jgi:hypothetical protein
MLPYKILQHLLTTQVPSPTVQLIYIQPGTVNFKND